MASHVCHFLESLIQVPTLCRRSQQSRLRRYRQIPGANSPRLKSPPSGRNGTRVFFPLKTRRIVDSSARSRIGHAVASWTKKGKGDQDDVRIQVREFDIAHEQGRSAKQSLAGFQRAKKVRAVNVSQAGRAPVPCWRDAAGRHRNRGPRRDVCDLAPQIRGNSESDSSK